MTALNNTAISAQYSAENVITINVTAAWTGTLTPEASIDGGSTWAAVPVTAVGGASVATITANGAFTLNSAGYTSVRLRVSVVGTGTASVAYRATTSTPAAAASSGGGATTITNVGRHPDRRGPCGFRDPIDRERSPGGHHGPG